MIIPPTDYDPNMGFQLISYRDFLKHVMEVDDEDINDILGFNIDVDTDEEDTDNET